MNIRNGTRRYGLLFIAIATLLAACSNPGPAETNNDRTGDESAAAETSADTSIFIDTGEEDRPNDTNSPTTLVAAAGSITTDARGLTVGFTTDGYPFRGDPGAPVLIEEFSDYQCPFCGRFATQTLPSLEENEITNGEAVMVFYDFPLTNIHPQAMAAHNAAHCAGDQGAAAYWAMHDQLFANINEWGNGRAADIFTAYAEEMGLDLNTFRACLDTDTHVERIQTNVNLGISRGVQSTPSFFLNDQMLVGAQPLATFERAIAAATAGQAIAEAEPTAVPPGEPYPTPAPAAIDLDLAAATLGDPNAPVTIVEYSDYQCPYCQRHSLQTLPALINEMVENGRVYYVFMDYPLDNLHPQARNAAAAARCAGNQNAYWEMHDALFASVEEWAGAQSSDTYTALADELGLDTAAFAACLESDEYAQAVQSSLEAAAALGVVSTPSFYINGYPMRGAQPFEIFEEVVTLAEQNELGTVLAEQQRQAEEAAAPPPEQPAAEPTPVDVPLGDAYAIGNPDAPVTIVEYTDFQCPFCQRHAAQTLPTIIDEFVDEGLVYYVFKDFPLTQLHPQAIDAAEAARCAEEQDAFLAMHEQIFAEQSAWSGQANASEQFVAMADSQGLDTAAFTTCLESNKYETAVLADLEEGQSLGVTGTPSFFINGYFIAGAQPLDLFASAVDYFTTEGAEN